MVIPVSLGAYLLENIEPMQEYIDLLTPEPKQSRIFQMVSPGSDRFLKVILGFQRYGYGMEPAEDFLLAGPDDGCGGGIAEDLMKQYFQAQGFEYIKNDP